MRFGWCCGQRRRARCWRGRSAWSLRQWRTPWSPSARQRAGRPRRDSGSCRRPGFCGPRPCFARAGAGAGAGERELPGGSGGLARSYRSSAARSSRLHSPGRASLTERASLSPRVPCGLWCAGQPVAGPVPPPRAAPPRPGRRAGPNEVGTHSQHAEDRAGEERAGAIARPRALRGRLGGSADGEARRGRPAALGRRCGERPSPRSRMRPPPAAARPRPRVEPRVPERRARWGRAPREAPASREEGV